MSVKALLKCSWIQNLQRSFHLHTRSSACMRSPFPHAAISDDEFQKSAFLCRDVMRCYDSSAFWLSHNFLWTEPA